MLDKTKLVTNSTESTVIKTGTNCNLMVSYDDGEYMQFSSTKMSDLDLSFLTFCEGDIQYLKLTSEGEVILFASHKRIAFLLYSMFSKYIASSWPGKQQLAQTLVFEVGEHRLMVFSATKMYWTGKKEDFQVINNHLETSKKLDVMR